jgi:tetratricopeptide (TPR) repeat protein
MTRNPIPLALVLVSVTLGYPSAVAARDNSEIVRPVVAYVGNFLLNKLLIDEAWDAVTGKPDVKLIERRLRELENNAALRSELRDEIRKLRENINERVTRDEFRKLVERTSAQISSIQERLDELEERVEKLEVEKEDLKNNTKNAEDAEFFFKRGNKLYYEKSYYRALANLNIAIRLDPKKAKANLFVKRAMVYDKLGSPDIVILEATEAIRRDPTIWGHELRGGAYHKKGDYDLAIADQTTAIRRNPDWNRLYLQRGLAYYSKKDYDRAIVDFTETIGVDPKNIWSLHAQAYHYRGLAYYYKFDAKNLDRTIADLTESIRLDPKDERKRHEQAYLIRGFQYALRYQLKRIGTKLDLAFDEKDRDQAIADFTEVIRINPKNATAYYNRSSEYKAKGDKDRAKADLADYNRLK